MNIRNEKNILNELGRIVAQHSGWIDGRTFQRLCLEAADAYFDKGDRDDLLLPRLSRLTSRE